MRVRSSTASSSPSSDIERAVDVLRAAARRCRASASRTNRHYFDCGGVILALRRPARRRTAEFRPNPDHVYFAVADLEAAYERARTAGCQWLEDAIATRDWGERSFYARDPFGNPLCFVDETTLFTGGRFVP